MKSDVVLVAVTTPISLQLFGNRLHLLVESGVDLHVVAGESFDSTLPELPHNASIHIVKMKRRIDPIGDMIATVRFARLSNQINPTVVAAATPKASLVAVIGARIARVPVIVWEVWGAKWDRPSGKARVLRLVDRLIAKTATHIFAVSHSLATLMKVNRITKLAPEVVGFGSSHGVDVSRFFPSDSEGNSPIPRIGYVGRICNDKGIEDVYSVALHLRESWPALQLVVVGSVDASDPPPQALVQALMNSPWITCTGWVENSAPFYRDMDVFLFPSIREGLPNAVLEAAASGLPTVGYQATGTIDAVENGITGTLVPPGDREGLRKAVASLLRSGSMRRSLARASRNLAVHRFDSRYVELAWTRVYLDLSEGARMQERKS